MSKEAMKLALGALEVATTPLAKDRQEVLRAQAAIREALAEQPAQQEQDRQIDQLIQERDHRDEIIDKLCDAVLGPDRYEWSSQYFFEDAVREVEERMAALRERLAQPEPEPVAWKDRTYGNLHHQDFGNSMPLYTSPPASKPWVGLTDAEIGIVSADIWGSVLIAPQSYQAFARAIEAKLKEKNT